jgi:hypothetical protein
MAGWRTVIELTTTDEEIERLMALSRSSTERRSFTRVVEQTGILQCETRQFE